MAIKKTYTETKVPCYFYIETGVEINHCKDCSFFNGYIKEGEEITGVDCLRKDIGQLNAHVLSFEANGYLYKCREYDKAIDGPLSEEYHYCEKCCFNKTLQNGKTICLLRCGGVDDENNNFTCYDSEIWEKEKIH